MFFTPENKGKKARTHTKNFCPLTSREDQLDQCKIKSKGGGGAQMKSLQGTPL